MENTNTNLTWELFLLVFFYLALQSPLAAQTSTSPGQNAWINEIHYDNSGTDVGETIEVVVEKATFNDFNISELAIHLYNGENSQVYSSYTFPEDASGINHDPFFIYTITPSLIQNGPDGIALSYGGQLIQFLSYEGVITAVDGVAAGFTSVDILVEESGETPLGHSLQLSGTGDQYGSFTWTAASPETFGAPNNGQLFKVIDGPEPITDFKVVSIAPDKVSLSWTKPIGIHDEDWSGVLIFGREDGPNAIDLTGENHSSFGAGGNVFGAGSPIGESYTVARKDTDQDGIVTITGLLPDNDFYHFVGYSGKTIRDEADDFSVPSTEIVITPKVAEVTAYTATPLNEKVKLTWSNSMGKHEDWWHQVLIIASENPITALPDREIYAPNEIFGAGEPLSPGEFTVFMGTDSLVFIEGLENNKDYYFKIFVRYDTEEAFYWSSGLQLPAQPKNNKKYWLGGAENNLFSDDANWMPSGVPDVSHDVVLDNSIVPDSYEVLSTGDDEIHLNSLTIAPENKNISVKFSSQTNNRKMLVLHDNKAPLSIADDGVLINNIVNTSGTIVLPNGEMTMEPEAKYVHSTSSASTPIFDRIKLVDNCIPGVIEFNHTSGFISLAGRTFQELVFAAENSYTSAGGSAPFSIRRALTINENSSLNLNNLSAPIYLGGDLNLYGKLIFDGDLVINGTGSQRLTGPSETPIQINSLVINKPDNNLHLEADVQIKDKLEFISGNIETGDNKLLLDYAQGENPAITGAPTHGRTIGNLEVIRNVSSAETHFEYAGISFKEGSEDLGAVRITKTSSPNPNLGRTSAVINRSWAMSCDKDMTSAREVTFSWHADEENNVDLLNVQLWQESEIPDEWVPVGEAQDGTARSIIVSIDRFSHFAISDTENPLPITLLSFEVVPRNNDALLKWTTGEEINNAGFEIEKSIDGEVFYKIGFVPGANNSRNRREYHYTDQQFVQSSYYRLKQMDFDGEFEYSPIRLLTATTQPDDFVIFPNPVEDELKFKTGPSFEGVSHLDFCYLINSMGIKMYESGAASPLEIEKELNAILPRLQSGIYVLSISYKRTKKKLKLIKK